MGKHFSVTPGLCHHTESTKLYDFLREKKSAHYVTNVNLFLDVCNRNVGILAFSVIDISRFCEIFRDRMTSM